MTLTASLENYLEVIAHLSKETGYALANDIAEKMDVKRSSVTVALRNLAEQGLISYEKYKPISLTREGNDVAANIIRKHNSIMDFLVNILGLNSEKANDVACKMEHVIGEEVTERLVAYVDFVKSCPRGGEKWFYGYQHMCHHGKKKATCEKCISLCLEQINEKELPMNESMVTLDKLPPGGKGIIKKILPGLKDRVRYAGMGLVTGSPVEVVRIAPLGDPLEIKVKGYGLSLRKDEAANIKITQEN